MIRVLIVDDHTLFRESLTYILDPAEDRSVVAGAGSIGEALQALECAPIDVALFDLDLVGERGLDLVRGIHAKNPEAVAIILTGSTGTRNRALAISAGAGGLLHKSTSTAEILATIRKATAGEPLITAHEAASLMAQGAVHMSNDDRGQKALDQLSVREREVLRALARGLDNNGIAHALCFGPETVRTHIVRIYRELEVESRLQAVLFAKRHGLLNEDDLG